MKIRPYKKKFDHSYTFGVFPTIELLECQSKKVIRVLIDSKGKQNKGVEKIRNICLKNSIKTEVADGLVRKLSGKENTYAVGIFEKYEESLNSSANHLVLVGPRDPGNMGTIMRTMLGFGMKDLAIVNPAVDVFDPKTVRASMGGLFQIRFRYFDSFAEYRKLFVRNYYPFMTNGSVGLKEVKFESPFSLIFGNESAGLDDSFTKLGTSVMIPQEKNIDSLNLAVAVGIGLYESCVKI